MVHRLRRGWKVFSRWLGNGEAMNDEDGRMLRRVADYQFGAGAGAALFPTEEDLEVYRTTSGRPQQVVADAGRLVTYAVEGRFTLSPAGARRLLDALDGPTHRVVVGEESDPFVREGRNTFAKFVKRADPGIRPGDEVAVVRDDDTLLGVGRAELAGEDMLDFGTGMAVFVRHGVGPAEDESGEADADEGEAS
jgi:uncharacterized protein with predicted RNA binding PUA domain